MKPKIAFFDVDDTIVRGNIEIHFLKSLFFHFQIGPRALFWTLFGFYRGKPRGIVSLVRANKGYLHNKTPDSLKDQVEKNTVWVLSKIKPGAKKEIEELKRQGIKIVLLSASLDFLLRGIAKELGADEVIGARPEIHNGYFTGNLIPPQPYASGKVSRALEEIHKYKISPSECVAYGNSHADIPLLSFVGRAMVIKPCRGLRRYAKQKGWELVPWE